MSLSRLGKMAEAILEIDVFRQVSDFLAEVF